MYLWAIQLQPGAQAALAGACTTLNVLQFTDGTTTSHVSRAETHLLHLMFTVAARTRRQSKGARVLFSRASNDEDDGDDVSTCKGAGTDAGTGTGALIGRAAAIPEPKASQGSSEAGQLAPDDTAHTAGAKDRDAAHRPLVIVVEGTESLSPCLLRDLIFVISEVMTVPSSKPQPYCTAALLCKPIANAPS